MWSVSRSKRLSSYQHNVYQLTKEEEAQRAQLCQADSVVTQVETIESKHAEEDREQEGCLVAVAICGSVEHNTVTVSSSHLWVCGTQYSYSW